MKLFRFLKNYWLKIISFLLIIFLSIYVLSFGIKRARDYEILKGNEKQQTIYTVWHIETFEGGGKSRIEFLKTIARQIEKKDETSLFMIKQVNPLELKDKLKISQPDIISFGYGVGQTVLPYLNEINETFNIRDELISSGSFNNKFYAVPFMLSGYAMFSHSANSKITICGSTGFTKPESFYNTLNLSISKKESQYEAYKQFVYDKNSQLIGSGRDLFRINNLNNIGRTNALMKPIETYTDLIQYIGIINQTKTTNLFLNLALSNEHQNTLTNYFLFSSKYNKLYFSGIYSDMENAIFSCAVPNVFA